MRDYLTTAEVAEALAVTKMTLCYWRKAGIGPLCAKSGAEFRYPKNAFQDYLDRLTGGDAVPKDITRADKRRLFVRLHRDEPPLDDGPSRAELANRLAVVEGRLAKIEADKYRKAPVKVKAAKAKTRRMVKVRKAAEAKKRKASLAWVKDRYKRPIKPQTAHPDFPF